MCRRRLARAPGRGIAAVAVVLSLAGCGGHGEDERPEAVSDDKSIRVEVVQVGDRRVPCILWDAAGDGGLAMSCDWAAPPVVPAR